MRTRRHLDSQGRPIVDVEREPGVFSRDIDEQAVSKLGANRLELTDGNAPKPQDVKGKAPYGPATLAPKTLKKRSGLDYMRALSEEIKRRRSADEGQD